MKTPESKQLIRWTGLQIGVALAYFLTGKLGLALAFMHNNVSAVWPPTGLALGVVLVFGYRVWPAIFVGLVALTAWGESPLPWPVAISVATGNAMEAIVGAWLFRTLSGTTNPLYDGKTFLWFLGVGVFTCTTISATVGVTSLCVSEMANWDSFKQLWWTWWLGDATGSLIVAPFVVALFASKLEWPQRRKLVEGVLVALALSLVCYFVFYEAHSVERKTYPPALLLMPALAWTAFRFTGLETSLAVLLVSIGGIWGTVNGLGPFVPSDANTSLLLTQTSFGLIAGTALLLSTLRAQQQRDEEQLKSDQELLRRIIELQEQDRRMVAHDIHDGIVQDIVGAHLLVQSIPCPLGPDADESVVNRLDGLLRKAINEGRRLIDEMRPMVLDERGVIEAIEHMVADFEGHADLVVAFDHDVKFNRLEARLEGMIFRMVQESLNNIEQHAKAKYAAVRLTQVGSELQIVVLDHGVGFDIRKVSGRRFGLRSIRERARLMGGMAQIESARGKGTTVSIQLPVVHTLASQSDREESTDPRYD